MSEFSWPWSTVAAVGDGTTTLSEALSREFLALYFGVQDPAVEGVSKGVLNELAVSGAASPVSIATGSGICYGLYRNTAVVTKAITTPAVGTTGFRVVLQTNWAGVGGGLQASTRIAVVKSADGNAAIPALTQTFGVTWEISLATGTITTGGVITLTDARNYRKSTAVVGTNELVNLTITTAKIALLNITTALINDLAVTTGKIADLAVTSGKLAALSVIAGKIADGAVDTAARLASNVVTTAKILDANVTTAKLALLSVTTAVLNDLAVTTGKIVDAAVTSAKLRNSAALSVIGRSAGSVGVPGDIEVQNTGDVLVHDAGSNTVKFDKVSTNGLAALSVTTAKLNDLAVTAAKLAANAVAFAKLVASAAGLSVIGRSANTAGDFAEIVAAADGDVLRRSGTSVGFGQLTPLSLQNRVRSMLIQAQPGLGADPNIGAHGVVMPDGVSASAYGLWLVPEDFISGLTIKPVVYLPGASANMRWSVVATMAANGGDMSSVVASVGATTSGLTSLLVAVLNAMVFTAAAGNYIAVIFTRDGANAADTLSGELDVIGFLAEYTADH